MNTASGSRTAAPCSVSVISALTPEDNDSLIAAWKDMQKEGTSVMILAAGPGTPDLAVICQKTKMYEWISATAVPDQVHGQP